MPEHSHLFEHYVSGSFGGLYLGFSEAWRAKHLPADGTHDGFRIVLKDTEDGKLYESLMYVAFDKVPSWVLDQDYKETEVWTLMPYFYGCHHCPCHRKMDAAEGGAVTDEECEGDRFLIERVSPIGSDLILVSEVYSLDELEGMLR